MNTRKKYGDTSGFDHCLTLFRFMKKYATLIEFTIIGSRVQNSASYILYSRRKKCFYLPLLQIKK